MTPSAERPADAYSPTPAERKARNRALLAAMAGFALDAMDVLLYVFALQTLRSEFGMSNADAGLVSSVTLITSAAGGIGAGILADRFGRKRLLIVTILIYSIASAGTALSGSFWQLVFWRAMVGIGLGGEWSAGATLVAETWPVHLRQRAISFMQSGWSIGYMLAAALSGFILPRFGWRVLFLTGLLPALLTVFVRQGVQEPPVWQRRTKEQKQAGGFTRIFKAPLGSITLRATALASTTLLGYWGLFTWVPGFLSAPVSAGGAGISMFGTSSWVFLMQAGGFAGYIAFGFLCERFGRRNVFTTYVTAAAILTLVYGNLPAWGLSSWLVWVGPFVGFFGTGFFSLFGALLAEIYPTSVRGAGQGFCYNFGRLLCAAAPWGTGLLADSWGIGAALGLNSGFFLISAFLIRFLPERPEGELAR